MGLITKEVETTLNGGMVKYYENLGYEIPKRIDNQNRLSIPRNTKIKVNALDLTPSSNVIIKAKCDICGKIVDISYAKYNKNITSNNGEYYCNNKKLHNEMKSKDKLNLLKELLVLFLNKNDRFPKYNEYTKDNGFNFGYACSESICKSCNTTLNDLLNDINCFKTVKPAIKHYDDYVNKLKEIVTTTNLGTSLYKLSKEDNCKKFGLPNIRWLIDNCPDKTVNDLSSFKTWAGFYENYLNKEQCIEIILKMSKEYNRPLMYDDFRGTGYGHVSIQMIRDYWGSVNKMKKALGLEIIQESMVDKQLSEEETIEQIKIICDYVKQEGRNFTTTREIDNLSTTVASDTLRRMVKKYFKMSLPEYFKLHEIDMGKEGQGITFKFDDGERTTSQFEYMFSKYLREFGLVYNKDYFRDVKYKDFIPNYNQMMNCDYVVNYNGRKIYIEIAGIIEAYKTWYYENKPITMSKSKEKYRLKLKEKEKMLKDNNLIYFILFPCDLTRDIFMKIINDGSLELKYNIEHFMKNNIDWVKIQEIGELKYKENETSCYGQLVVDYQEVS